MDRVYRRAAHPLRIALRWALPWALLGLPAWAGAQDASAGALRAAIRTAGHACAHVVDRQPINDDGTAWAVRCNSGLFHVTLKGTAGADVIKIQ